jgi:hypothetical protein
MHDLRVTQGQIPRALSCFFYGKKYVRKTMPCILFTRTHFRGYATKVDYSGSFARPLSHGQRMGAGMLQNIAVVIVGYCDGKRDIF